MIQGDYLYQYLLFGGQARAMLVSAADIAREAQTLHGCTPLTTAALSRALIATIFLEAMQKGENTRITMNIKGGGIAGDIVCVAQPGGQVKGYIEYPLVDLPLSPSGQIDVGFAVGSEGRMSVVRDMGIGEPYVGQVRMVSGEIAEDVAFYMTASEQTPSLLALGERITQDGDVLSAGGLLLQPMPDCGEEALRIMEESVGRYQQIGTAFAQADTLEALGEELLRDMEPDLVKWLPIEFRCDCSEDRVERALMSLGAKSLLDMAEEGKTEEIVCSFCNSKYYFGPEQLRALAQEPG